MNNKFDELTKTLTRRGALKKFSLGLAGMALAAFGLANKTSAQTTCLPSGFFCQTNRACCSGKCSNAGNNHQGLHLKTCL